MAEWISVKDRSKRPDDGDKVWCYGDGCYFEAFYDANEEDYDYIPFGFYERHFHPVTLGFVDEEFVPCCATHWMPLPEPPREDE